MNEDLGQEGRAFEVLGDALRSHKLSEDQVLMMRKIAESNLYMMEKFVLGYDKIKPHIHRPICEYLQNFETMLRFRLLLPRGWFKTTVVSIGYPIWRGLKDPNSAGLIAQNTDKNALSKLASLGNQIESNQIIRGLWHDIMPDKTCMWNAGSKCLRRTKASPESTWEAAGIRTQVTSRHYNYIIEDDTVAPDLDDLGTENVAPSKDDIGQAIGWHRLATPLLRDQKTDQIIVVGTRWFPEDLLEWIRVNEKYYVSYERACRETNGVADYDGQVTFPESFDDEVLKRIEASMGPYMFRCLYLNQPVRSDDMIFDPGKIQYYDELPPLKHLYIYTTVDPAGDPEEMIGKDTDYNVVLTAGVDIRTGFIYVLDYVRRKMNPGELIEELFEQVKRYNPIVVGVETIAYANTLVYHIKAAQQKVKKFFRIENLTHGKRAKNARIQGLQPLFYNGRLKLAYHMKELVNELVQFPIGKHDDVIDCLAMQLRFWAAHSPEPAATIPRIGPMFEFDPDEAKASIRRGMIRAGLTVGGSNYLTDLINDGGGFDA